MECKSVSTDNKRMHRATTKKECQAHDEEKERSRWVSMGRKTERARPGGGRLINNQNKKSDEGYPTLRTSPRHRNVGTTGGLGPGVLDAFLIRADQAKPRTDRAERKQKQRGYPGPVEKNGLFAWDRTFRLQGSESEDGRRILAPEKRFSPFHSHYLTTCGCGPGLMFSAVRKSSHGRWRNEGGRVHG
jgi:hypothetical protein